MRYLFLIIFPMMLLANTQLKIKDARYSEIDDDGFKKMALEAKQARMFGQDIQLYDIDLKIFKKNKDGYTLIVSPECFYDQAAQKIKSQSPLKVTFDEGVIEGVGYDIDVQQEKIRIRSQVEAVFKIKKSKEKKK